MGLLDNLGAVSKFQELLTEENLGYLDKVLTVTLTPAHQAYNTFWLRFQEVCGGDKNNVHFTRAAGALTRLHALVKDMKKGGA